MVRKIGVGHAGCGSVSIRGILPHITQPDAKEWVELVAVSDVDAERAAAVAQQFGAKRHYGQFEQMLQDDEIDLVIIATPIVFHSDQAEAALRAGKHVYVMKSMALNLQDANRVIEAARDARRWLACAPGQMSAPSLVKIRELVKGGDIGQVYWGFANNTGSGHRVEFYQAAGVNIRRDPTWYYQKPSGGPIYDMGVYSLHSLTGILGPAKSVSAMSGIVRDHRELDGQSIRVDMDDNTWMLLDFGDNCVVSVGAGLCHHGKHLFWGQLALYGSEGGVEVTEIHHNSGWPSRVRVMRHGQEETFAMRITEHDKLQGMHATIEEPHIYVDLMNMVDAIHGEAPLIATAEHARHAVEIIEKAYISARTGQRQTLETTFQP